MSMNHRARVLAVRLGLRPPLHPDRLAVVLPAELEHDSAGVGPLADRRECLLGFVRLFSGVSAHERHADCADDFLGFEAQNPDRGPVRPDKARIEILMDVRDRRLLKQVAVPLLAFNQSALDAKTRQLGRRAGRKDRKISSFRGSRGIGRVSKTARCPRCSPSGASSGTPR